MGGKGKGVGGEAEGRVRGRDGGEGEGRMPALLFFPLRALAAVYFSGFLFWRCHGQVGVQDFRSA